MERQFVCIHTLFRWESGAGCSVHDERQPLVKKYQIYGSNIGWG